MNFTVLLTVIEEAKQWSNYRYW